MVNSDNGQSRIHATEFRPPPSSEFPTYPASWYLFGASRELGNEPLSKRLLNRDLVAFRPARGQVALLDARCSHMGADLGRGSVIDGRLRCPFHGWEYAPDGACAHVPSTCDVPEFARQVSYPVVERHGHLFFFNGRKPLFPLPFFAAGDEHDFVAAKPFRFDIAAPWYVIAANAFDMQHFNLVHSRQLQCEPESDCPAPFARRIRYRSKVVGNATADRLLRSLAGDTVDVAITSWGATFFLVTARFRKAQSYILFDVQPADDTRTTCNVFVFLRRQRLKLLRSVTEPISLWARRQLTKAFVLEDPNRVGQPVYRPGTLIASDRAMIEYYRWAASLPQSPDECSGACSGDMPINAAIELPAKLSRPANSLHSGG